MSIRSKFALSAALVLAAGGSAHATIVGMNDAPLGARSGGKVEFAYWDSFSQTLAGNNGTNNVYTFSGVADGSSSLTALSLIQSNAHVISAEAPATAQGAGLLNGGDVYYASTFLQTWTMTFTSSVDLSDVFFQIKTANVSAGFESQTFVPTLDGYGQGTYVGATAVPEELIFGRAPSVLMFKWEGLDIDAGTPVEITFALAGGSGNPPENNFTRKPVDFVAIDAVPEPTSAALLGVAALVPALRRRRSK